jgi:translocation and assembly module TamB
LTRPPLKWVFRGLLVLLAVPVLAVVAILVLANTDPGRRFIQTRTPGLTGGMVRIDNLSGRFPDALTVGQIQIADAKGPYLTIQGLVLDWSPLALLHRTAQIDRLQADRLEFSRLPESASKTSGTTSSSAGFSLPVQVDLRRLHIAQAIVGAPIAGVAATLALDGSATVPSLTEGTIQLDVRRLDSPGHYVVAGTVAPHTIQATIEANEPPQGLISSLSRLPDLGAISIQARVDGPMDGLSTKVAITAGSLSATASGTVDLQNRAADMAIKAQAPAMAPAPDVSWQSILMDATVHGKFTAPDAKGTIKIEALNAAGFKIGSLAADVSGTLGQIGVQATVQGLHLPGPRPDIFAADPVMLNVSAQLDAPDRPVTFTIRHPLADADGTAKTKGAKQVQLHLTLPDLSPLATAGGADIDGSTNLDIQAAMKDGTTTVAANGQIAITGGKAPVPALIGTDGHVDLAASIHGQDITVSRLTVNGKTLSLSAHGTLSDETIDADWTIALSDLATIRPDLSGKIDAKGHAGGKLNAITVQADIGADLAAKGYSSGHITARIDATGLPAAPHATIAANGMLLESPLTLALTADEADGTIKVDIGQAAWKSLQAGGAFSLAPLAAIPTGNLHVVVDRLADLQPLLGQPITGQAKATLDADDKAAKLTLTLRDLNLPGTAAISKAALDATIADPFGHPNMDATLSAEGLSVGSLESISARATAKGPFDALGIAVTADAPDIATAPAKLTASGTLNAQNHTLALAALEATWKQQGLRLLAPARFNFAQGVTIDRIRLGLRQAELTVSGRAGSTFDLTATLRNLPADIAAIVNPDFAADGTITADARLTGTSAHPEGTVKLTATGLRQRQGPGQTLPAANLTADIALAGTTARIDTKLTAGSSQIAVAGSASLSQAGALALTSNGRIDLAMLDPLLTPEGRRARGTVTLDAAITGTTVAPQVAGSASLHNGDLTDHTLGAHIKDLEATIQAQGDTVRLTRFSGKAGPGTLGGSGSIGLADGMPVDLHFTANNARPLSSDLMTALIDANLTVQGHLTGDLQAGGTVHVRRAEIRIPDKLPQSVAMLPVRIAGARPPPAPPPQTGPPQTAPTIALNLTLDAPQQIFIRGRGLDAELGGTMHVRGTDANPIVDGGFQLRRGTFTLVGTTLTFSEGSIDFTGAEITDPGVSTSSSGDVVATLTISGHASDPKITLSSVPSLPQDEILSQLLFKTSTAKLSPFQLAQIAAGLASLSGATPGFDPLEKLRTTFGLDRLSVGRSTSGNPTLEAGRYLAPGVYLGAKQNATGTGTQATVQIDIAKGLKLETTAGSGSNSATGSAGSADAASLGLTYRFEY